MALSARGVHIGFRFPTPQPMTEAQFEAAVADLGGVLGRGMATQITGGEIPVVAIALKAVTVIYEPTNGIVSFKGTSIEETEPLVGQVLPTLLAEARIREDELTNAEIIVSFLAPVERTALSAMKSSLPPAPAWASEIAGVPLMSWGVRYVGADAAEYRGAFRTLTPWFEVTVEPFADNPQRAFIKFLIRDKAWPVVRDRLKRLGEDAERVMKAVLR